VKISCGRVSSSRKAQPFRAAQEVVVVAIV